MNMMQSYEKSKKKEKSSQSQTFSATKENLCSERVL